MRQEMTRRVRIAKVEMLDILKGLVSRPSGAEEFVFPIISPLPLIQVKGQPVGNSGGRRVYWAFDVGRHLGAHDE